MDLRQLEIFVKVAEIGSFSRAAEALHLTQPTVSEHIRTLEDELGVRLLDRLGRGAAVTRAGELLGSYAGRMLALQREARQALDSFQGKMSGGLVMGASTIPGEYVLPPLIGRFKDKYPEIVITLLIGDSQAVVGWVVEGKAELGVVGARLPHRAGEYRELMPDEEVVVVPAGHAWYGRTQVTLEELRAEPLLLRERGSGARAGGVGGAAGRGKRRSRPPICVSMPSGSWGRWARRRPSSRPSRRASASRSSPGARWRRSAGTASSGVSA